jgi:hypothetical protein
VAHPLVLALFSGPSAAAAAARAVHQAGVSREQISVVARSHDEEGALAREMDATPGADMEDSRPAAVLGELSGQVLAAIALVLPGVGPIVAAGPLSAELGEAAGHAAGSVGSVLSSAGVPHDRAESLEREVEAGSILLAVHVPSGDVAPVRQALMSNEPLELMIANWDE